MIDGDALESFWMLFPFLLLVLVAAGFWIAALILKNKGKYAQPFFYLSFFCFLAGGSVCLFVLVERALHF